MTGTTDDNFGIMVDVEYTDGTFLFGQALSFPTGTHNWEYTDRVIELSKPASLVNVTVLLREHTGMLQDKLSFHSVLTSL